MTGKLAGRIARQIAATAVMAGVLIFLTPRMEPLWTGGALARVGSLASLVAAGGAAFFAAAFVFGALDKDLIAQLRRRRPARPVNLSE